jgi:16S rRNA processing protein RimM
VLDVGRIVRPHGLKGQVVVELWTNLLERMRPGTELATELRTLVITSAVQTPDSTSHTRWLVAFEGLQSREDAEQFRDAVLRAEPIEVEGALWVHQLIGADLYATDGTLVGRVEAVEANPASDLLILEDGRLVPLTFVSRSGDGRYTVDGPPGLLDLEP